MAKDGGVNVPAPRLVPEDASFDPGAPLPAGLERAGEVVHWEGSPNFGRAAVRLDPEVEVSPGQFLGVWHGRRDPRRFTIVQVADCLEVNPNEAPDLAAARAALGLGRGYAAEGVSTRIYRLADCATLEERIMDIAAAGPIAVGEGIAAQKLTRAGDVVAFLPDSVVAAVIGTRLDEPGVDLGTTYGAVSLPAVFRPEIFQFGIGIFGSPGKGKSFSGGKLLEEGWAWGVPSLVLDIHGEFSKAAEDLGGLVITLPDPKRFGLSLNLITPSELLTIVPNMQPHTQYAELVELSHTQLREEAGNRSITLDDLKNRVQDLGPKLDVKRPSIQTAVSRIAGLEDHKLLGSNFDFIATLEKHTLVVLDCRFLSLPDTRLVATAAARELQRAGRERARKAEAGDKKSADWFALLFIDEAHLVVPTDEKVVSTQVLLELSRMGRHVHTGLVLVTQSPADVHSSVLKRAQTRLVFALEADQLRAIHGVTADLDEKIVSQLPKLPRGVCAVSGSSELVRHGFLLQIGERSTRVGGSTPPVFARRKKRRLP